MLKSVDILRAGFGCWPGQVQDLALKCGSTNVCISVFSLLVVMVDKISDSAIFLGCLLMHSLRYIFSVILSAFVINELIGPVFGNFKF